MFGTRGSRELRDLEELVGRVRPLSALAQFSQNLGSGGRKKASLVESAVCLDTCVLLHLAKHKKVEEILDYFATVHRGLLIVSAQTLQEFWNNHIFAIETVATGIERRFLELEKEILKVDSSWSNFSEELGDLLGRLRAEYGHLHEPKIRARFYEFSEQLASRAFISEVPRSRFYPYAEQRKKLKTPPGFEDAGNGDFFIWLDFLFATKINSRKLGANAFGIMVTDDKKRDWSKGAVPHPVLAAEMDSYAGLQFETWSLDKLWAAIEEALASAK